MAEDIDYAARECYSRLGSAFKCTQEEAAPGGPQASRAQVANKAQTPQSVCRLPEARIVGSLSEAETGEGEYIGFALCLAWEKFKSLISGISIPHAERGFIFEKPTP